MAVDLCSTVSFVKETSEKKLNAKTKEARERETGKEKKNRIST